MKLVIVESPTKARTLSRFLPKDYKIEASMGHVRDLPQKGGGLSIDVEHGFEPKYEVISAKKKKIAELKKLAEESEEIYLAPDPDREGEAIAYHVQYLLSNKQSAKSKKEEVSETKFKRVTFHEITKSAITEALTKPGVVDMNLVNAQQARRVLDRLVGYKLSPVLWKKVRRGLSAGRVQSVAVKLIVEREREREAFVPEEYWEIGAELRSEKAMDSSSELLRVSLSKIDGKKSKVTSTTAHATMVVSELEKSKYRVSGVTTSQQSSSPNPPYTTSLLQRAASNVFGWSAKQTMSTAQALYEHGLITYHRTDSYNLATEAISAARSYIERNFGREYLPETPRYYKTKSKSAQEAHEAIRPTDVNTARADQAKLDSKHLKLYELIRNRFLQCQMADAKYDKTSVIVSAGKYELVAEGKRVIFDGYLKLGKQMEDVFLPVLQAGDALQLVKVLSEQKFTEPPSRYSEAGLIKELEKRGIGRPSTYASIITTIQSRNYVVKEQKSFAPTAIGLAVTDFLVANFETVMAYEFTANMEDKLDEIAEGKHEWVKVVGDFYTPFEKKVKEVESTGERVKVPVESTGEKCPECKEGEVVIRTGRFGKFLSCSTYPECKYTKQHKEYAEGHKCPDCGGAVVVKGSRRGKFYGCENYPKCKWASWKLGK